jgi:uncharacterized lipoprotein NlpE involved in copper resistance
MKFMSMMQRLPDYKLQGFVKRTFSLVIGILFIFGCQNNEDEDLKIYGKWQSISRISYTGASANGPWSVEEVEDDEIESIRWIIEIEKDTFTLTAVMSYMGAEYTESSTMSCTITDNTIILDSDEAESSTMNYTMNDDILTLESIHRDEDLEYWVRTVTVLERAEE